MRRAFRAAANASCWALILQRPALPVLVLVLHQRWPPHSRRIAPVLIALRGLVLPQSASLPVVADSSRCRRPFLELEIKRGEAPRAPIAPASPRPGRAIPS